MQSSLLIKNEVIESEIVEETQPVIVQARMQIVVPKERDLFCMLMEKIQQIEESVITNVKSLESLLNILDGVEKLETKLSSLKSYVEWISVSNVATEKGLTSDAIRKQLQSGEFEEGVDFKYNGSRILINQGAIERIYRKRSSNA